MALRKKSGIPRHGSPGIYSSPTYKSMRSFRIPPTGSWWIVQVQPRLYEHANSLGTSEKIVVFVVTTDRKAGLRRSTNCRWWDSNTLQTSLLSRSDLNNLRTAVLGDSRLLCNATPSLHLGWYSNTQDGERGDQLSPNDLCYGD